MSNIPTSLSFASLPPIGTALEGGTFVGITTKPDGTHVAVIRLPGKAEDVTWKQAKEWAAEQGGELPSRPEAALLFANDKKNLAPEWHWTRDEESASYAWGCSFYYGLQYYNLKDDEFSAVAVRPIPIHSGDVVVTWDYDRTRILAVTRQNDDHQIVEVIAEAPATQASEPNWRHPKIQALIGADARNRITIDLIWKILEDPDGERTASDMEYWDAIHDAVKAAVAAPARAVEPLTQDEIREAADAADEGQEDMEFSIAFASRVVKVFCKKNGITPPKD